MAAAGDVVTLGFSAVYLLGLLGPLAGAVATTGIVNGRARLRDLAARALRIRVGARWWAVVLPVRELRAIGRERDGRPAHHVMAHGAT